MRMLLPCTTRPAGSPPRSVPRRQLHSDLRDRFCHKFRAKCGLPLEDHGILLLQVRVGGGGKRVPSTRQAG